MLQELLSQMQTLIDEIKKCKISEDERDGLDRTQSHIDRGNGVLMNTPNYDDFLTCLLEVQSIETLAKTGITLASTKTVSNKMKILNDKAELMKKMIIKKLTMYRKIISILGIFFRQLFKS